MHRRSLKGHGNAIIALVLFIAMLAAFVTIAQSIRERSRTAQTDLVKKAVEDALITCYAIEGRYPENPEYLKQNYDLLYDEETYLVSFDSFASNIIPDVLVSVKGAMQVE